MNVFSHHKLIKEQEGYTLVLYFDNQSFEFARDFFSSISDKTDKLSKNAADSIKTYVNRNFRNVKINTVKIMLGSLLIASIPYTAIYTSNLGADNQSKVRDANASNDSGVTSSNSGKENEKSQTQSSKSSNTSNTSRGLTVTPTNNLVLVNKTHSLSSSYVPKGLVYPKVATTNRDKTMMTKEAALALEALFKKAKQDKIELYAVSGYRSFSQQKQIFASNTIKSGSIEAANKYSAKPGQSEHQTGLAMDISSKSMNFTLEEAFAQTPEGKWLKVNAPQFGFIIRYNKGKENITGYQFEPWHIRYVGKTAAMEISKKNITLEEYLSK